MNGMHLKLKILVTYDPGYGATASAAETIAAILTEKRILDEHGLPFSLLV
jgi:hypothetical protein